jgi:hypothetical protein
LTVAWEVYGLNSVNDPLTFRISLIRDETSFVRRALRRIGLARGGPVLTLTWSEEGSSQVGPLFRAVDLDLPALEPGGYVLRLVMEIPYRESVASDRRIEVF